MDVKQHFNNHQQQNLHRPSSLFYEKHERQPCHSQYRNGNSYANLDDSDVLCLVVDVIKDLSRVQDSQSATTDLTTTLGLPEGHLVLGFKFVASSLVVIDAVAACTFGYKTTNTEEQEVGGGQLNASTARVYHNSI